MNHSEPSPTGGSYWQQRLLLLLVFVGCWALVKPGVMFFPRLKETLGQSIDMAMVTSAIRWVIPIIMVSNHVFGGCIQKLRPFGTFHEGQAINAGANVQVISNLTHGR